MARYTEVDGWTAVEAGHYTKTINGVDCRAQRVADKWYLFKQAGGSLAPGAYWETFASLREDATAGVEEYLAQQAAKTATQETALQGLRVKLGTAEPAFTEPVTERQAAEAAGWTFQSDTFYTKTISGMLVSAQYDDGTWYLEQDPTATGLDPACIAEYPSIAALVEDVDSAVEKFLARQSAQDEPAMAVRHQDAGDTEAVSAPEPELPRMNLMGVIQMLAGQEAQAEGCVHTRWAHACHALNHSMDDFQQHLSDTTVALLWGSGEVDQDALGDELDDAKAGRTELIVTRLRLFIDVLDLLKGKATAV